MATTKFNVGDKLKVLNTRGTDLHSKRIFEGDVVTVTPNNAPFSTGYARICVNGFNHDGYGYNDHRFELIVSAENNGVDGTGQPTKFETKDLKTLQRVVLRNGDDGIVSVIHDGFLRIVKRGNCQVKARMSYELENIGYTRSQDIVAVYDLPEDASDGFDFNLRGKLLFKAVDAEKLAARAKADETIAKVKAELAAAEAARAALN